MVAHVPGKGHFVGDHQHGHALLSQPLHNSQHLAHHFRIQGRGGFVKQQHLRIHGQGAGDGHTLLLTAGNLPGLGVNVGSHAHLFQVFHGGLPGTFFIPLQNLHLTHHAVFQHGHVVEQVEGLEHHTHMAAVFRLVHAPAHHVLPMVEDLSGGRGFQKVNAPQQGAFAGAGSTDDRGHVTLFHGEINIPQHLMGTEAFGQVVHL